MRRVPDKDDKEIGRELKWLRAQTNLNQGEVGAIIGVSHQQYGKFERGEDQISAKQYLQLKSFFLSRDIVAGRLDESDKQLDIKERFRRVLQNLRKDLDAFEMLIEEL